jgi:hypothetical protein
VTQLISFSIYAHRISQTTSENADELHDDVKFLVLKVALIVFSLIKFISLLRVFPQMGFFIKLISQCLIDIVPFVQSYVTCNLFFTFCFVALDCENDPDIEAVGLGRVGSLSMQVWR